MGVFDKLFGKKEPSRAPEPASEDPPPGWAAIDAALARIYPDQKPRHLANGGVRWMHDLSGTANPLDGVHVFDAGEFWHYIGLGLTELYLKECADPEVSGLGYELTFRLRKDPDVALPPTWPVGLMNGLGRPAMRGELVFDVHHTVKTGAFDSEVSDGFVGVIFHNDPSLPEIDTPHGRVRFLQLVPVDAAKLARASGGNAAAVLAEIGSTDPRFITTPPRG